VTAFYIKTTGLPYLHTVDERSVLFVYVKFGVEVALRRQVRRWRSSASVYCHCVWRSVYCIKRVKPEL